MPIPTGMLADPASLALRVGASQDDPAVTLALQRASDRFRADCGHSITKVEDDVVILDGHGSEALQLPAVPVMAVSSVTVSGVAETNFSFSPRAGVIRRKWGVWPDDLGNISVVYTHGYDTIPGDVQDAVLENAEVQYIAIANVTMANIGGEVVNFGVKGSVGVTERWTACVMRYKVGTAEATS